MAETYRKSTASTPQVLPASTIEGPIAPTAQSGGRYLYIDALRGIAAVLVMLHHLLHTTVLDATLSRTLPTWFLAVCEYGNRGVQIFFVISGFVIAHSMRTIIPNLGGSVNFIVRRQIRLDPPYWIFLLLTLADFAVENRVPSLVHHQMPGPFATLLNFVYLQNVVGVGQINAIAWTLCLEIQFYLLFMMATTVGHYFDRQRLNPSPLTIFLVALSGVGCLTFYHQQRVLAPWFPSFWPYFAFGVVLYWATHRLMPTSAFVLYAVVFAAVTIWTHSISMTFGLTTAMSIFAVAKADRLRTLGSNRLLQYLGGISYSLYLVHTQVLSDIQREGYKLTHKNGPAAVCWFIVAAFAAVLVADVYHRVVEVPSIRWAARLKPRAFSAS